MSAPFLCTSVGRVFGADRDTMDCDLVPNNSRPLSVAEGRDDLGDDLGDDVGDSSVVSGRLAGFT